MTTTRRGRLLHMLFEHSAAHYARHFKRGHTPWGLTTDDLLAYPEGSLGHSLGQTLNAQGFELLPKLENHDVFHILTHTPTDVVDEIGLQFLLWGNGKSSLYMWGVILLGTLTLPEHLPHFLAQRCRGTRLNPFHHWDTFKLLRMPLAELQRQMQPYP